MQENIKTFNNYYGMNQFYYYISGNIKSIFSLSEIESMIHIDRNITIKFKNNKSIREDFDNEEMADKFFMYLLLSLSDGNRVIGRVMFDEIVNKQNNE